MTTPKLTLTETETTALTVDALVIGVLQGSDGIELAPGSREVADAYGSGGGGDLLTVLETLGVRGKADEVTKIPAPSSLRAATLVAAGLGSADHDGPTCEQVRRASGAASRALAGVDHAASTLSTIDLSAAATGTLLGAYQFTEYKSADGDAPVGKVDLVVSGSAKDSATKSTLTASTAIANAVRTARDFINTPPNDLYPEAFAERAQRLGRDAGLEVEVLDEHQLAERGHGGILGVGSGSSRPPRLLRLRHKGPKNAKKVALIGKGITFDTGGISLKAAAGMPDMTSDMSGAAAVVATAVLAAELNYPLEVVATVPMAENMPSGSAYRPGDVLSMYAGKTVEVLNTDAEGRLVLADAIALACEEQPDYLVETSTLTGAQQVALGARTPGVMGSDQFRDRVAELSRAVGENGWAMPLPEELRAELDSKLADLTNVTGQRWGGMLVAGIFLREFVAEGVEWAHIDVAGPAYNTGSPWGYTGKGGTGVPVRTMAAVLADIAENQ